MDALSEVLSHVRLKETRWACALASAPWGIAHRETKGCVRFHFVSRGSCWLSVDKSSQPRVALSGGDLVVVPQGHGHVIRDQPRSHLTKFEELMSRAQSDAPGGVHRVSLGSGGAETNIIYGAFMLDDPFETPMLAGLPPVIRVTPDAGASVPSFHQNLQFISRELDSNRPGSQIVLTRMADVIFVQVLRTYIESLPEGSEGFLGALRDKNMAAALGSHASTTGGAVRLLPRSPDQVGLSRSGFAARFPWSSLGSPRSATSRAFECNVRPCSWAKGQPSRWRHKRRDIRQTLRSATRSASGQGWRPGPIDGSSGPSGPTEGARTRSCAHGDHGVDPPRCRARATRCGSASVRWTPGVGLDGASTSVVIHSTSTTALRPADDRAGSCPRR